MLGKKSRKVFYNAPLHKRQKMISANLSKDLRKQLKRRNLAVRKGDDVKVMRGSFKGKTGKVAKVMLKRMLIEVEGVKRKKSNGEEAFVPIHTSNVMILNPVMDDSRRIKRSA